MPRTKQIKWRVKVPIKVDSQQFAKEHFFTRLIDYTIKKYVKSSTDARQGEPVVRSIPQTAKLLKTSTDNVYALVKLGLLRPLKLGAMMVPLSEIDRFVTDNLGKDLREVIEDEKERNRQQRLSGERSRVVKMR